MTGHADRIRGAQRHKAEPASRSRLAALDTFGLRYEMIDEFNCLIEGWYTLNLAMSFWRSIDGASQGYLISALDGEIKRQRKADIERLAADVPPGTRLLVIDTLNSNYQKPTGGRDSIAADRAGSGKPTAAIAESPVGPISSSLLPVVMP